MSQAEITDIVHLERELLEEYQRIVDEEIFRQSAIAEGICIHFNGDQGIQVWFRTGEKNNPVCAVGYTVAEALYRLLKKNRNIELSSGLKDQIIERFREICRHDGKRHSTNHGYSYYCDICGKHLPSI